MSYTPNLNLLLTPEDDTTTTFKDWRVGINGEEGNSNMAKIDEAYGALNDQTQKIQSKVDIVSDKVFGEAPKTWGDVQTIVRNGAAAQYFDIGDQFIVEKLSAVTASKGTSTGITAVTVNAHPFVDGCGEVHAGEYVFTFDGKSWHNEDGKAVELDNYGISVTGTAKAGDHVIITETSTRLAFDVIGIDHDIPTDKNLKHSLTLQLHHSIGGGREFDAVEALFYVTNELPAGTYNFTLIAGYDESHGGGKTYSFTLTRAVPKGGIIMFPWGEGTYANQTNIKTYGGYHNKTLIETVSVTEGEDGVSLESLGRCNDTRRIRYGSNNWKQSAIRQYLNSNKPGQWWDSMTKFDTEPTLAISPGFLCDMDAAFLAVIGEVDKTTILNTITDGGGSETNAEKFFLLSVAEVYGGTESGISEGNAYPYYSKPSDLSAAGAGVDTNRIKYHMRSLQTTRWLLRTPNASHPSNVRFVEEDGVISNNRASNIYDVAPACCII